MRKYSKLLNLKIMRVRAGFTQKELAEKIGVEYHVISSYENGWRSPRLEILYKVANVLKCDVKDLI